MEEEVEKGEVRVVQWAESHNKYSKFVMFLFYLRVGLVLRFIGAQLNEPIKFVFCFMLNVRSFSFRRDKLLGYLNKCEEQLNSLAGGGSSEGDGLPCKMAFILEFDRIAVV